MGMEMFRTITIPEYEIEHVEKTLEKNMTKVLSGRGENLYDSRKT